MSAILNTVTVRIDADQFRQLLIGQVDKANVDDSVKEQVKKKLRSAPADTLGKLHDELFTKAVSNFPNLVNYLSELLK